MVQLTEFSTCGRVYRAHQQSAASSDPNLNTSSIDAPRLSSSPLTPGQTPQVGTVTLHADELALIRNVDLMFPSWNLFGNSYGKGAYVSAVNRLSPNSSFEDKVAAMMMDFDRERQRGVQMSGLTQAMHDQKEFWEFARQMQNFKHEMTKAAIAGLRA
jgi:hypothetical protein